MQMQKGTLEKVIYPEISYILTGIFFSVHNDLGACCREKQYCDAIEEMLKSKGIKYRRELGNKDDELLKDNSNKVDFLIDGKIIIEVKAKRVIGRDEYQQTQRYLKNFNLKLGMIVNFHQKYLAPKRVLNSTAKE